jgi:hypothetical protein
MVKAKVSNQQESVAMGMFAMRKSRVIGNGEIMN